MATYPRWTDVPHSGWELPGPNQHYATAHNLESVSGGSASRSGVRVAMPDWSRVAEDFDADTPVCSDERLRMAVWGGAPPDILYAEVPVSVDNLAHTIEAA